MKSLPVRLVATFFVGLRAESRTVMKLTETKVKRTDWLLMMIVDSLSILIHGLSGSKLNHEDLLTSQFAEEGKTNDLLSFENAEEFEKALERLRKEGGHG